MEDAPERYWEAEAALEIMQEAELEDVKELLEYQCCHYYYCHAGVRWRMQMRGTRRRRLP